MNNKNITKIMLQINIIAKMMKKKSILMILKIKKYRTLLDSDFF
jgi:hypothetical protein